MRNVYCYIVIEWTVFVLGTLLKTGSWFNPRWVTSVAQPLHITTSHSVGLQPLCTQVPIRCEYYEYCPKVSPLCMNILEFIQCSYINIAWVPPLFDTNVQLKNLHVIARIDTGCNPKRWQNQWAKGDGPLLGHSHSQLSSINTQANQGMNVIIPLDRPHRYL